MTKRMGKRRAGEHAEGRVSVMFSVLVCAAAGYNAGKDAMTSRGTMTETNQEIPPKTKQPAAPGYARSRPPAPLAEARRAAALQKTAVEMPREIGKGAKRGP